jgi:quinol monooxygenase YgiN
MSSTTTIALLAIHHPRPDHVDDWTRVLRRTAADSEGRAGFVDSAIFRDTRSNRLVALTRWETEEAVEGHVSSSLAAARELDGEWGAGPTEMLVLEPIS